MRLRLWRLLLVVGLVVALAATSVQPIGASLAWSPTAPVSSRWEVSESVVVPYLPNNDAIAATGPWHGVLQVANANAFPVTVVVASAAGNPLASVTLNANGSTAIAAASLFGANPGGGLVVRGQESGACVPQAVQEFVVTRGPGSSDAVPLGVPSGVTVTNVVVSQTTTQFNSPGDYSTNQVMGTLFVNWASGGNVPATGSTYQVLVSYSAVCRPARLSVAVKLVAPIPSVNARTGTSHLMVSGYSGGSRDHAVGDTLVLPIAQANYNGWRTVVHLTNYGPVSCSATMQLYQHPSGALTHSFTQAIAAGGTWHLDLSAAGVPAGWLGTGRVQASGCDLAATLDRIKPQQPWGTPVNMALTNLAWPATGLGSTVYVPLVFRSYFNWNTGIAVTNAGASPATVTISYYSTSGVLLQASTLPPVPANGMQFAYLTGASGQLAQAVITSTQPIVVSVDAVKYSGQDQDVGQALTTMGIHGPVTAPVLRAALFQKAGASGNDTSGLQLFNTGSSPTSATVQLYNPAGVQQPAFGIGFPAVPALGAVTVYAPNVAGLPSDFQGQARVSSGNGQVVAVTNNVNYDVQADGSASFDVATAGPVMRVFWGRTLNANTVATIVVAQIVDADGQPLVGQSIQVNVLSNPALVLTASTNAAGTATVVVRGLAFQTVPINVCWMTSPTACVQETFVWQ